MTVPTHHLRELTRRLRSAGFTVLDTGERVTTDEGPEGEATLRLLAIPMIEIVDPDTVELGVSL